MDPAELIASEMRNELVNSLGEGKFNPQDWIRSPDNGTLTYRQNLLIHLRPSESGLYYYYHYGRTHFTTFLADFIDPNEVDLHMSRQEEQKLLAELQDAMKKTVYEASVNAPQGQRTIRVDHNTTPESLGAIIQQLEDECEDSST